MSGAMQRNVGGLMIYRNQACFHVLDCRTMPFETWGTLPRSLNIWQSLGQLKIYFLAVEFSEGGKS